MTIRAANRQLKYLAFITVGALCWGIASPAASQVTDSLYWPMKNSRTLAATFGEYRPGHVHMGLDIRSRNGNDAVVSGLPVYAVGDGYISRIKIRFNGYGKTLYLQLKDGKSAVYAHLDSFTPPLQEYILNIQWDSLSYEQDFFLPDTLFPFKKGDVIAFSGRSGTKLAHLHFELRSRMEIALNPLAYGLYVDDTTTPSFAKFAVIPVSSEAEIDGDCRPATFKVLGGRPGFYYIASTPKVYGKIGLAVDSYDRADDAPNPLAVYSLELSLNQQTIFSVRYDSCDYQSFSQIDIDRDPYLKRQGKGILSRLFAPPGCDLPFYTGQGIIDTRGYPPGIYEFAVEAADYYGNAVTLTGKLNFQAEPQIPAAAVLSNFDAAAPLGDSTAPSNARCSMEFFTDYIRFVSPADTPRFYWEDGGQVQLNFTSGKGAKIARINYNGIAPGKAFLQDFSGSLLDSCYIAPIYPGEGGCLTSPDGNLSLTFPPGGVFDTLFAALRETTLPALSLDIEPASGKAYRLEPQWAPLKKSAVIKWRCPDYQPQTGIYYLNGGNRPVFLGCGKDSAFVTASCKNLETLALLNDRYPPELRLRSPNLKNPLRKRQPVFHFAVSDNLSGLDSKSLRGELDGIWILTEYDPPRSAIYAYFREPLTAGKHSLVMTIADRCGNEFKREYKFTISGR